MKNFIQNFFVFSFLFFSTNARAQDLNRLEKLANYLETVQDDRFEMTSWGDEQDPYSPKCAAGHATDLFASEGFILRGNHVYYENNSSLASCRVFFKLNVSDSVQLFYNTRCTRREKIDQIRKFVADKRNIQQLVASL